MHRSPIQHAFFVVVVAVVVVVIVEVEEAEVGVQMPGARPRLVVVVVAVVVACAARMRVHDGWRRRRRRKTHPAGAQVDRFQTVRWGRVQDVMAAADGPVPDRNVAPTRRLGRRSRPPQLQTRVLVRRAVQQPLAVVVQPRQLHAPGLGGAGKVEGSSFSTHEAERVGAVLDK